MDALTYSQFGGIVQCDMDVTTKWLGPLNKVCAAFEITTPRRVAGFIAQVTHECQHFKRFVENLDYGASGLAETWPGRFALNPGRDGKPKLPNALALQVGRVGPQHPCDQKALAIMVYGGRFGNDPAPSTDGWDYRGRGIIMTTFKDNYAAVSKASGYDFVAKPDDIVLPPYAAAAAALYWKNHGCNELMDVLDFEGTTRQINPAMAGAVARDALFTTARALLGV